MLMRFILFGTFGLAAQVVITAGREALFNRDYKLVGQTSLWMFPFYGLIAFLFPPIIFRVNHLPWWGRGGVYALGFFIAQYAVGKLFDRFGLCSWEYHRWTALPFWFGVGLGLEWILPTLMLFSH